MDLAPFRVELDQAEISGVRRAGTGTPLVLLHGFGGSWQDWRQVIAALPSGRPLVAYDQRGFGNSRAEPGTPFSHAEDLLAVLDALGIDCAHLCGMSLGGASVLNMALDAPDRVARLVLVSPLIVGWSWSAEWVERWKQIGRAARGGDMAHARELWWRHPLFDSVRESAGGQALHDAVMAFPGRQWVQDDQRPALPDVDRLSSLALPTLLLTGARDTEDFRLIADAIAALATNVTRIDHAHAGHMLNLENPESIAAEIGQFLEAEG
ncbi:alpha/beta fold hydrolase [Novosphingobium sp. FGD1]|jgi:pimeloyl-ACP methyl ester carboxylesterase|uniref:Alpha/beta fold hydrolase n=1 Tax=Novosphingobium silvae TaxID=2692619 RepID=A0A7X4K7L1_9SPHN|nr:alpha/beta hydrolase [Novosphingobium silvae]MYL98122.1 alpha/beta fold hydrolase [Novosphingobium silvae]